jgi:hypothetical protein
MPPAVIAAGVVAAGTIGGAVLGSNAQKSATNAAVNAQTNASNQQLQLGRESMGLNRDIYNSNYQTLAPFVGNGLVASNAMNALLNLPAAPAMTSPLAHAAATAPPPAPAPLPGQGNPASLNPSTALQALGSYWASHPGSMPGTTG